MAVTQFDKPSNYQLAPLPYEGMINRRFQMWNKEQDAMLAMHEQLGTLQGKISSYDVDPADREAYEQFIMEYTPQISEFAGTITGKNSLDSLKRAEWSKIMASAENHPKLKVWKFNKEQKDLARKNLESNKNKYTTFEYEDAYNRIRDHKAVDEDGNLNPYTAEGLYNKVDFTNKYVALGNQVIAQTDESFSQLSDPDKALRRQETFKTKEDIMNKVFPVAWEDNDMRREAKAWAEHVNNKQLSAGEESMTPEQMDLTAKKYLADKLATTANMQAFSKEEFSVVASGAGGGSDSGGGKPQAYVATGTAMLGQPGSEVKTGKDLVKKVTSTKGAKENAEKALNRFMLDADGSENARYYLKNGRYHEMVNGVETDVHSPFIALKSAAQAADKVHKKWQETDTRVRTEAKDILAKDQDLKKAKESIIKDKWLKPHVQKVTPEVKDAIYEYLDNLYSSEYGKVFDVATPHTFEQIARGYNPYTKEKIESLPEFINRTLGGDGVKESITSNEGAKKESYGMLTNPAPSKIEGLLVSMFDGYKNYRNKESEILNDYVSKEAEKFTYENTLFAPKGSGASGTRQVDIERFKGFITTNADIRLTNTNEQLDEPTRKAIEAGIASGDIKPIYNGATTDFDGSGIRVYTVPNPNVDNPKDPNSTLRLEFTDPSVITDLASAGVLDMARHTAETIMNKISMDPNHKGTIPFEGKDIEIEMEPDATGAVTQNSTFIAHVPIGGKIISKRYNTRKEFYDQYFGLLNKLNPTTNTSIADASKKK